MTHPTVLICWFTFEARLLTVVYHIHELRRISITAALNLLNSTLGLIDFLAVTVDPKGRFKCEPT